MARSSELAPGTNAPNIAAPDMSAASDSSSLRVGVIRLKSPVKGNLAEVKACNQYQNHYNLVALR